jgi:hypothetical protein
MKECPENVRFGARKMRDKRERDETETRGENREITKKEQRNAAHLFPDYQPPNLTNFTP